LHNTVFYPFEKETKDRDRSLCSFTAPT